MNIYSNTPYTYRISWSNTGMNYYGVRYANNCHPDDLFTTYFTSSKHVKNYIKEHGMPDIIEIRKTFTSEDRVTESQSYEHRALKKLKASIRPDYLNRTDNKSIAPEHRGKAPFDLTVYEFIHSSGIVEHLTRNEMIKKYNLISSKVCELIGGCRQRHKGWRLPWSLSDEQMAEKKKLNIDNMRLIHATPECRAARVKSQNKPELKISRSNADLFVQYHFVHTSGIQEHLTRSELLVKYQLDKGALLRLIKGQVNSHKGWSVKS